MRRALGLHGLQLPEIQRQSLQLSSEPTGGGVGGADVFTRDQRFSGQVARHELRGRRGERLRRGAPIVAGYQVNERIAQFHSDARSCEAHGYLLPNFAASPKAASAHAVLLVGFDDAIGCFIARNSWGAAWGVQGHFLIRYSDLEDPVFFTDLVSFARAEEATTAR